MDLDEQLRLDRALYGFSVTGPDGERIHPTAISPAYNIEFGRARSDSRCRCLHHCGDDGDTDGPGICKGLPIPPRPPLLEIRVVHRSEWTPDV